MAMSVLPAPRVRRSLGILRALVVIPVCAAIIVGAVPGACGASAAQWSLTGDSTFKAYMQTTFRLTNTTNLRLVGSLGPLKLNGTLRLLGASYGLSGDVIKIGPWAEKIEKWSVSARMGALSVTLGDTYVPVMSGRYLSGNTLYGLVASTGGEVAGIPVTATAFHGANTVSSGLSVTATDVTGAAVEVAISPRLGLTVQGLKGEREGLDIKTGGAKAWFRLGGLSLDIEGIASRDDAEDMTGWLAAAGVGGRLLNGTATAAGQFASGGFTSMGAGTPKGPGGAYELSTSWSGPVYSGGPERASASLALAASAGGDNLDGSSNTSQRTLSSEATLTIRASDWLLRAKYGADSKKRLADESPTLDTVRRTASLEAAIPFRLGQQQVSADVRLSRMTTHNMINDGLRVNHAALVKASTALGRTSLSLSAGVSAERTGGGDVTSRQIDAGLSLSRPIKLARVTGLSCGLDLIGADKAKGTTTTRSADAGAWLKYAPGGPVAVTVKAKGQLTFTGADWSTPARGGWLEAEARLVF